MPSITSKNTFPVMEDRKLINKLELNNLVIGRSLENSLPLKINLTLSSHKIYHISGSNGSGKTTFMKTLCSYMPMLEGEITFNNNLINTPDKQQFLTAYFGHDNALKTDMSVKRFLTHCHDLFDRTYDLKMLKTRFCLDAFDDIPIHYLSCGQKRRVSLVSFFLCNRDIYCLDEAASGLDTISRDTLYQHIIQMARDDGKIILFSDHINPCLDIQETIPLETFYTNRVALNNKGDQNPICLNSLDH